MGEQPQPEHVTQPGHVVFWTSPSGEATHTRVAALAEAVALVSSLRNDAGVTEVELHALTPVPLAFRTVTHIEVSVAGALTPEVPVAPEVPAAPVVPVAPASTAPVEQVAPVVAPVPEPAPVEQPAAAPQVVAHEPFTLVPSQPADPHPAPQPDALPDALSDADEPAALVSVTAAVDVPEGGEPGPTDVPTVEGGRRSRSLGFFS